MLLNRLCRHRMLPFGYRRPVEIAPIMFLLDLCQWLDSTRFNAALRQSNWAFPTLDTIHTLGIVLVAGTIMLVDFRLLGLGLRSVPVAQMVARIVPATLGGFGLMLVSGGLLFSSEAVKMYHSPAFRIKMILLALAGLNALIFHRTIYRDVANWDPALVGAGSRAPGRPAVAALLDRDHRGGARHRLRAWLRSRMIVKSLAAAFCSRRFSGCSTLRRWAKPSATRLR